jgi:hypothetical protein
MRVCACLLACLLSLQELQLQDVMQEMQQRLESGGAVGMSEFEAGRQRIAALTIDSPGTPLCLAAARLHTGFMLSLCADARHCAACQICCLRA